MADQEQLRILKQGVEPWNTWRKDNPNVEIDLTDANFYSANLYSANLNGANLYSANLNGANFYSANLERANFYSANLERANLNDANLEYADLRFANLEYADLTGADLRNTKINEETKFDPKWRKVWEFINRGAEGQDLTGANLTGQDLTGADLRSANLQRVQALGTNFDGASLTGACIEDWNINSETNFENVICDYIYLKEGKQERRPSDPNRNFEHGEFAKLVQKSVETVDLIFKDGIDWRAFLSSYQDIQVEYSNQNISIQAIENKSDGAFVIRLNAPSNVDKGEIESKVKQSYETQLKVLEADNHRLLQHNASLENIVNTLASRPIIVEANAVIEKDNISNEFNAPVGSVGNQGTQTNVTGVVEGDQIGTQHNYASPDKQNLAEAAAEIQKLLQQLKQNNPDATPEQQEAYVNAAIPPTLKQRCVGALKAGGETAIEEFLDNPYVNVGKAVVKAWIKPE